MNPSKARRGFKRRMEGTDRRETYVPSHRKIEEYQKKKAEEKKE